VAKEIRDDISVILRSSVSTAHLDTAISLPRRQARSARLAVLLAGSAAVALASGLVAVPPPAHAQFVCAESPGVVPMAPMRPAPPEISHAATMPKPPAAAAQTPRSGPSPMPPAISAATPRLAASPMPAAIPPLTLRPAIKQTPAGISAAMSRAVTEQTPAATAATTQRPARAPMPAAIAAPTSRTATPPTPAAISATISRPAN